jgi:hypothetical protein
MLVRLIAADQVVLLLEPSGLRLFYQGKVYLRDSCRFNNLPFHNEGFYIWTLVNVDSWKAGPPLDPLLNLWPVQASPPNPAQFGCWVKQYCARVLGMPLWNTEELIER